MKYSVPAFLLGEAGLVSGCALHHSSPQKGASAELPPATGIETEFYDRWMDRRIHELLAAGSAKTESGARAVAAGEFTKQYPFIQVHHAALVGEEFAHGADAAAAEVIDVVDHTLRPSSGGRGTWWRR